MNKLDPEDVLKQLSELRKASAIEGEDATAKDKTSRAGQAFGLAWMLLEQEAGWAIDHLAGLALSFPGPFSRADLKGADKDTHAHEQRAWKYDANNPLLRRRAIIGACLGLPDTDRAFLLKELGEALEDLEVGHIQDILKPADRKRGKPPASPEERRCWLDALQHYKFRVGAGWSDTNALSDVTEAYGIGGNEDAQI